MKIGMWPVAALVLLTARQPAAADNFREMQVGQRTAGFIGIRLQMNLGSAQREVPSARLAMGLVRYDKSQLTALHRPTPAWLEFGASRKGHPEFYVAGRPLTVAQNRLGIDQTTAVVVGVGLIAIAAAVAVSMKEDDDKEARCQGIGVCPD